MENILILNLFFNLSNRKRARNNIIENFNENKDYNKILNFIIENNIFFNVLNSNLFKELLNY